MKSNNGFSLIELIMVITTIGILAFVAISKSPTTEISLEAAAHIIKSDIRSVQALAMARHAVKSVNFSGSTTYSFDTQGGTQQRDLQNIFGAQITIAAYPSGGILSFNSLGEPTAGFGSSNRITVSSGALSKDIEVLEFTGKVQ